MNSSSSSSSLLEGGYKASVYVRYGVAIPQQSFELLGLAGVHTERDTRFQLSTKYYITLVGLPVLLFLLGIFSMTLMNLGLLSRYCFHWMSCYPQKLTPSLRRRRQRALTGGVMIASLLSLLGVALLFLANAHLDSGIDKLGATLSSLSLMIRPLREDLQALTRLAASLVAAVTTATAVSPQCSSAVLQSSATALQLSLAAVANVVDEVAARPTQTLNFYVSKYLATNVRKYATYALAVVPAVLALLFLALTHLQSLRGTKLLMGCSVVFFYVQVLAGLPAGLLSSLLADVCISPFAKILDAVGGPHSDAYNLTRHYTVCGEGPNLAQVLLVRAGQSAVPLRLAVKTLSAQPACSSETATSALWAINATTRAASLNITHALGNVPSCATFRALYVDLIDKSVCQGLFPGLLEMALSLLLGSFALWMSVVLASLLCPHYDPEFSQQVYVGSKEGEEEDEEEQDDEEEDEEEGDGEGGGEGKDGEPTTAETEQKASPASFEWGLLKDDDSVSSEQRSLELMVRRDRSSPYSNRDEEEGGDGVSLITQHLTQEEFIHDMALNDPGREDDL